MTELNDGIVGGGGAVTTCGGIGKGGEHRWVVWWGGQEGQTETKTTSSSRIRYTTISHTISESNPAVRSAWRESGHWLCKDA